MAIIRQNFSGCLAKARRADPQEGKKKGRPNGFWDSLIGDDEYFLAQGRLGRTGLF